MRGVELSTKLRSGVGQFAALVALAALACSGQQVPSEGGAGASGASTAAGRTNNLAGQPDNPETGGSTTEVAGSGGVSSGSSAELGGSSFTSGGTDTVHCGGNNGSGFHAGGCPSNNPCGGYGGWGGACGACVPPPRTECTVGASQFVATIPRSCVPADLSVDPSAMTIDLDQPLCYQLCGSLCDSTFDGCYAVKATITTETIEVGCRYARGA